MSETAARSSRAATRRGCCSRAPAVLLLLTVTTACGERAPIATGAQTRYPAPEPAPAAEACADLGATRVCWRGSTPQVVPRVVPEGPAPAEGWRCGGAGQERVCEDRSRNGSRFDCGTQRCLQARPRMPDDGEWECVEISGVVYCHSRGAAAGMQPGPSDLGWLCEAQRGGKAGERICVDLDADRPSAAPAAGTWHCRFELRNGRQARSCTAAAGLQVGSACTGASACPDGSRCSAGLCLPERPEPACFYDRDCGAGARCVLGSCRGG